MHIIQRKVKFSRAKKQGHLQIDGERVADGSSQGRTRSVYLAPPFYLGGIPLDDNFNVGLDLEIKVDIKPRTVSGVILAVHSKGDYLVLQMVMGRIVLIIDDGIRAINTTYSPQDKFTLCNGQWHTIRVIKAKEELTLFVDGMTGDRGQGKTGIQAVHTNGTFYVGGVPDYTAQVFQAESSFTGCIRNLLLNGELQYLSSGDSVGNVKMDSCPVS